MMRAIEIATQEPSSAPIFILLIGGLIGLASLWLVKRSQESKKSDESNRK
ncbi:hypothetical protein G7062_09645 [Erysipelothrix sp. HDW6C]|nr:hypothetical protein [Erysipelothrix sp. HDW6C]QIK70548.1 hypothetical protein G7062_09645 [Erysipelothrix sp. HDW6C]